MDVTSLITQVGFPAAVAIFALWASYKHEEFLQNTLAKTVDANTNAINELKLLITKLLKKEDLDDEI